MIRLNRPLKTRLREPTPSAESIDATWASIQRQRGTARSVWLPAAAFALVALLVGGTWLSSRSPQPQSLTLADGTSLPALQATEDARTVRMSDGSTISLSPATQLRTRRMSGAVVQLELERGEAWFDIVPHGPRLWSVQASDVTVRVLGTRFSVTRSGERVAVDVSRGLVEVLGPRVAGGRAELGAGQQLLVREPVAPEPQPTAAASPNPPPEPPLEPTPAKVAKARPAPLGEPAIARLLAQADAARRAGQLPLAAQTLELVVRGDRRDARTALAAFTLGRLYADQLARPERAALMFERAAVLGLPSALADECAWLRVEAHGKAGHRDNARKAARAYLAHFPNGAHRAQAQGQL